MEPVRDPKLNDEFLISQYLDGDLDHAARLQLEKRLQAEPELARILQEMRATDALVSGWATPIPEMDWDRFTQESADRRQRFQWHRRRRLQLWVPLAAAAMIVFAVSLFWDTSSNQSARPEVLLVQYERMDQWRGSPGADQQVAVVQFNHAPPALEALAQRKGPNIVIGVAGAGLGPKDIDPDGQDLTPFF